MKNAPKNCFRNLKFLNLLNFEIYNLIFSDEMKLEVYSHPVQQSYRSALITKAVIFQVILFFLLVVSPLLVAYRISGFWIKQKFYTEQPYVT